MPCSMICSAATGAPGLDPRLQNKASTASSRGFWVTEAEGCRVEMQLTTGHGYDRLVDARDQVLQDSVQAQFLRSPDRDDCLKASSCGDGCSSTADDHQPVLGPL